ncbi:methyltransferase [Liquorilactobacillus sucicola DSM 21376 = JCM 15457]|uniref:Putative methyltransferase (Putative) n=1 Tax=Liquorilactobacillus sucicola DSM 21376 = JCM 15457 TaxID=1423806 RepID=A0A023CUQ1_9LACO|nr:class I SAM-dependent methyltransferase [Liquorilactobacillus sucicola]KRN05182.1 putative methyltransferase (putative) [Liquorilactobacillus sucicola DSM 21376 = JCM 15457]GAJ25235.1 methyltransferase [Liquorilactobacillus sucicola DSM 21376 = JCM 15457]
MNYTTFAQLYDELMEPKMYTRWCEFIEQQVPELTSAQILDLACGTGRMAILLAQKGYKVAGADLSADMLSLAEERARKARVEVPLIEADMLDLAGLPKFDVITCCLDSLCYLKDKASMVRVFKQVYKHLQKGGNFIFDVISPYQTDVVYPGYMYNYTDDKQAFIWKSYDGAELHSVIHDLTFFVSDNTGDKYERLEETHYERTYPLNVYLEMLDEAGFESVREFGDFGCSEITQTTRRWFFSCHKM